MRAVPNRPNRRSAKGQAMAIFALVSVLLFVVAGLSIDAGTSYLTSNKIERAAAAAALAGVAYLPADIPDAQNAALVEAARDGFPNAGRGQCVRRQSVAVRGDVGAHDQRVEGHHLGNGRDDLPAHRRLRLAHRRALRDCQYLPPISLGQPGGQQGAALSDPSCTGLPNYCAVPASGLGSGGNNYYFERRRAGATRAPKVIRSRRQQRSQATAAARAAAVTPAARPQLLTSIGSARRPVPRLLRMPPSTTRAGRTI